jgi:hypothetical protein
MVREKSPIASPSSRHTCDHVGLRTEKAPPQPGAVTDFGLRIKAQIACRAWQGACCPWAIHEHTDQARTGGLETTSCGPVPSSSPLRMAC